MTKHLFAIGILLCGVQLMGRCQPALQPLGLPGIPAATGRIQLAPLSLFKAVPAHSSTTRTGATCANSCPFALPLTALELQGHRLNDQQVVLNWKTKHETGSRGFDIERSLGDAAHFRTVGSLASNTGASMEKRYASTDVNPYAGVSFYRIRQIDIDGGFAYSNTIGVNGYDTKESVWLSPNPASSIATLTCFTAASSTTTIKILAAHGQTVYQAPWALNAGSNTLRLPVAGLPSGMYQVQIAWPDGHRSELKFFRQ